MIIYNPENMIRERIKEAEKILDNISYKYCFITGSFLYKEKYKDIDVFAITKSNKGIKLDKKIKLTKIDFNDLHSLFYHSISKSCIAKNILPKKQLRITIADYWNIINETIPTIINEEKKFHKAIRSLVLYTEYLKYKKILDSDYLSKKVLDFKNSEDVIDYIKSNIPTAIKVNAKKSYIKRYFYTQAGFHKQNIKYPGQKYLYEISHAVIGSA